jgi:hypothetical protein
MTYRRYVQNVCRKYGIKLFQNATDILDCVAYSKARIVYTLPITNAFTFAIALHEVGHILSKYERVRVQDELNAWIIARKLAGKYWNRKMLAVMKDCYLSHYFDCKRRRNKISKVANDVAQMLMQSKVGKQYVK